MSSPHRDFAVQTAAPLTERSYTFVGDNDDIDAAAHSRESASATTPCECSRIAQHHLQSLDERCDRHPLGNSSAARRHFAKYDPRQLQEMSDEIELGWDCGIWCVYYGSVACVSGL